MNKSKKSKILPCVIGLGYVGLPVFIQLNKNFSTIGFDINKKRINTLNKSYDFNNEHTKSELKLKNKSIYTNNVKHLKKSNFYIIAVPTPVKKNNEPDLKDLIDVSKLVAKKINPGDIIVFESTVYPGTTKMLIDKYLNKISKLNEGTDYHVAYSPERINPGDKKHNIKNVKKVLAIPTSNRKIKNTITKVYYKVTQNLIFTNSIENAETAKVIENIQRDLNIAFMNDVFIFSNKMNLDYKKILYLASTKWNFLKFNPGLVGGHCLPVDPYYLSYIAKKNRINLRTVLAGRSVNNYMQNFIKSKIEKKIKKNYIKNKYIVISGITYKKDVPDIRNSIPLKIYLDLRKKYKFLVAYDNVCGSSARKKYKILSTIKSLKDKIGLVIFLVNHKKNYELFKYCLKNDIKVFDPFKLYLN